MKLNAVFGKGSGKVGGLVFAVSGGEQIVKEKASKVSNPNTNAQMTQRAKFKLISQIAANLAPIIAFKKEKLVSARNQFVSANIGNVTFANGQAELTLADIDLTGSSAALPGFSTNAETPGTVEVQLGSAAPADIDGVLYALVHETAGKKLEILDIKVAATPGNTRNFAAQLQYGTAYNGDDMCVYAYGIKYTDASSRQRYANYVAEIENGSATLDIETRDVLSGASFTQTLHGLL